jgi:hypothetical protein
MEDQSGQAKIAHLAAIIESLLGLASTLLSDDLSCLAHVVFR